MKKPKKSIGFNTLVLYSRSILVACCALLANRWLFKSLGVANYGLFSIINSMLVMVVFINNVVSNGDARFFSFSMGSGQNTKNWFNASLMLHIIISMILVIIGYFGGHWLIYEVLNISFGQKDIAITLFQFALISAFFIIIGSPFVALYTSKQTITGIALLGVIQSIVQLIFYWFVCRYVANKMFYIGLVTAINISFFQLIIIIKAFRDFHECSLSREYMLDFLKIKRLLGYISWLTIGSFGAMLRDQGSSIAINAHLGISSNAAYGSAAQVSQQANQFASSLIGAVTPEIVASEGRGDRVRVLELMNKTNRIGSLLMLFISVPILIEADYLVQLWLIEPPKNVVLFINTILITSIIDRLTSGNMLVVQASGKIAKYQITLGSLLVLTLPAEIYLLNKGFFEYSILISFTVFISLVSIGRVLWIKRMYGEPVYNWLRNVLIPVSLALIISTSFSLVVKQMMNPSFTRMVVDTVLSIVVLSFFAFFSVLDSSEKMTVKSVLKSLLLSRRQ